MRYLFPIISSTDQESPDDTEQLQKQFDESTNTITLYDDDLEKIPRYAFNYGHGGWENTLKIIFERTLGSNLGR